VKVSETHREGIDVRIFVGELNADFFYVVPIECVWHRLPRLLACAREKGLGSKDPSYVRDRICGLLRHRRLF
jgi:hypothetical protein